MLEARPRDSSKVSNVACHESAPVCERGAILGEDEPLRGRPALLLALHGLRPHAAKVGRKTPCLAPDVGAHVPQAGQRKSAR
jgi:hypothetical protein